MMIKKEILETYFYAFEKTILKVFSNFIKNIDDHKRNFWKHACMQNRKVHWKFLATLLKILMMMIFVLEKFFCCLKNTIISWWRSLKKSLETFFYAFEKNALKFSSNFIKNIDDHKRNLLNAKFERWLKLFWQELQSESDICDVTLACEDKQIKTHKIIILKSDPTPHSFIYLIKDGASVWRKIVSKTP